MYRDRPIVSGEDAKRFLNNVRRVNEKIARRRKIREINRMKMTQEITRKDFYFCYDFNIHKHFQEKGISYICSGKSSSNRIFWLYYRSDKVTDLLDNLNK
ncbi:hypothetical protein CJ467_20750 [Bacillus velezensis]|nr:hypothetical protein CJ467_20750 [Bacillus velezensis]